MGLCKPYYGLGKFYARKIKQINRKIGKLTAKVEKTTVEKIIKKLDRKVRVLTAKRTICEVKLERYTKHKKARA